MRVLAIGDCACHLSEHITVAFSDRGIHLVPFNGCIRSTSCYLTVDVGQSVVRDHILQFHPPEFLIESPQPNQNPGSRPVRKSELISTNWRKTSDAGRMSRRRWGDGKRVCGSRDFDFNGRGVEWRRLTVWNAHRLALIPDDTAFLAPAFYHFRTATITTTLAESNTLRFAASAAVVLPTKTTEPQVQLHPIAM